MLYHFVILLLSAKKLNHVRVSIDHRLVHYILANPKAKMTVNNNSQFTSLLRNGSWSKLEVQKAPQFYFIKVPFFCTSNFDQLPFLSPLS